MKKNKILAFGIVLCMLFSLAVVPASAETNGTCGDNLTWTLDDSGTLTISGTGRMWDYHDEPVPWQSLRSQIKSVVFENGVTSIGARAFEICPILTSITVPYGVTSIGDFAICACSSLTNVTIPDSVTNIGPCAFGGCRRLTSIIIPDSITSIEYGVFQDCSGLTSIAIPYGVMSISGDAFSGCSSLAGITIPYSVESIGWGAFQSCGNLADVYYGGGESDWGNIIFNGFDDSSNDDLKNANRHYYNTYELTEPLDYGGETHYLPTGCTIITTDNLFFHNGYIQSDGGIIEAGDKKITGENIYFTNDGKMRLGAGYTSKVELDNGDGTTDQGFMAGIENPNGIITMTLEITGIANDVDYTGRTISKDFDFADYEIEGLANFGFTVNNIPKPLSLSIQSIE